MAAVFNQRPLGERLHREAVVAFGKAANLNAADPNDANVGEYLTYVVGRVVDVFCRSLKESTILKKFANCLGLSAEWFRHFEMPLGNVFGPVAKEMMVAKTILGAAEVCTKWDSVVKPLRDRTAFVQFGQETHLAADGRVDNGIQAPPADALEQAGKKAFQVADWVFSVSDFSHYVLNSGVVTLVKETAQQLKFGLNVAVVVSGFTMSSFCLAEEGHRLWSGNIVRADPDTKGGQVKAADGFVWRMTWEDQVHSWMKIAMSVAYLVLAVYGAFALVGVLLPYAAIAKTACLSTATASALGMYFWEKITIDSLGRAGQRYIQP